MQKSLLASVLLLLISSTLALAQATVYGTLKDQDGNPLDLANIAVLNTTRGTISNAEGYYELTIPSDTIVQLVYSYLGYATKSKIVKLKAGVRYKWDMELQKTVVREIEGTVRNKRVREEVSMVRIPIEFAREIPSVGGGIEGLLKTMPGVTSSNELSSQYSVRGGSFDENLVYVNGFEIYRPQLVRSGQQEGLSFVNPDLVSELLFSSGGFQAQYGDKMSSVLDVKYKRPKKFGGSVSGSLLGTAIHLEGASKDQRFGYLFGLRHKTNQYVLNALETKGDYRPSFTDVQTFLRYDLSTDWELEFIGNYSRNLYRFIPENRITTTGVVNRVIRLTVFFDGQEEDKFINGMGGFAATYKPGPDLRLKFMASGYGAIESEAFDITGEYWLDEVESSFGSEDFNESALNLGVGSFQDWARNELKAQVGNIGHKGYWSKGAHEIRWGARAQHEIIDDKLREWGRLDSAGYSIPFSDNSLSLNTFTRSSIHLETNRFQGYLQNTWSLDAADSGIIKLTGGVRANYWDLNEELLISPRVQLAITPGVESDMVFRYAVGYYQQPPFYRELRDLDGVVHTNVRAQKSVHVVWGIDWHFRTLGNRPFKLVTELYYKYMTDLIPYEYDNVRIRYFGENSATGYATGIDFRLFGEFVPGADSWFSLSVMQTQEDIEGDGYYDSDSVFREAGFIPRPTDQRVNVGVYFQDYFPTNKNFKVHLNFLFGSGLPFGPPDHERFRDTLRIPPYRRVDIGFSAIVLDGSKEIAPNNVFRGFKSIWLSLEIFNLLGVNNTVSYLWIKDFSNTVYAVPNFLTSRRLNFKIVARF